MKIGFFCMSESHLDFARLMVESVKRVMPDVEVWHLADGNCATIEGAHVKRISGEMPMAVRRMAHHADCQGDWLFIDSDIILQKDVRGAFDEPFDVAVTDRIDTYMEGTPYAKAMPYNMGVTFSRSPKFWQEAKHSLEMQPMKLQEWEGDQRVVCWLAKRPDYNVKILPGRIYNYTPEFIDDDISHAAILHYKGPRKSWIFQKRAA